MEELEQLLEQARQGSPQAFTELVRRCHSRVRAYLGRFLRDKDIVDDLAQETFLKAYLRISTYRGEAPVRAWLLAIARNEALMHLRGEAGRRAHAQGSLRSALAGWLSEGAPASQGDSAAHDRELDALQTCMKGLASEGSTLVQEYYFNRRSVVDIARKTGRKASTVGMSLLRIRNALRQCIELRLSGMGAKS